MFWKLLRRIGKAWALAILIITAFAIIPTDSIAATANRVLEADSPIQGTLLPDDVAVTPAQYAGKVTPVAINWDTLPELTVDSVPSIPPSDHEGDLSDIAGMKKQALANPAVAPSIATVGVDSALAPQAPALLSDFQTIQDTGWSPPDPNVAVGPSHVGVIVNSSVEFYTKTGSVARTSTLSSWFSSVNPPDPNYVFDPKIIYDHHAGRWLIVALSFSTSPQASSFLVSASQSSDPTGDWWTWDIDAMEGISPASWADYPGVGFNDTAVYISANMFAFSGGFQGAQILCLSSAQLYSGSALSVYYWYGGAALQDADGSNAFTVQPVHTFGSPGQQYFVSSKPGGGNVVTVWRTPRQFPATSLYRATTLSTQSYTVPPDAEQNGGIERINTGDCRIFGAQYRNGYIYTAITSGHTWPNGSFRATVLYWKIAAAEPNYSLVTDNLWGLDDYDYYYPHVYSDSLGNVNMVFNRSGPTEYAGIRYTSWTTADSGWRASRQLKAGEAYYVRKDSYGRNRWGDYNGIAADPINPNRLFICSEYAKASNQWGTWVGEVTSAPTTYTIATSPAGLQVEVDGTSYTAPASFDWVIGSTHTIDAPSPQSGGTGIRYVYASWSDSGGQSHTITIGVSATTIMASFDTQYQLTMAANYGTTNPSTGAYWYDAGSGVQISATAPSAGTGERYVWNGWAGSGSGSYTSTDNPAIVTMNGPITQTGSWTQQYQLTIATTGLSSAYPATITVVQNGAANNPTAYATWSDWADASSTLTISNPVTVSATERYHTLDTTSWTVTGPTTHAVTYYHQFRPTISAVTAGTGHSDLDPTNYATLTYYRYGSPGTFDIFDAQSYNDWIDADSTAVLANPSFGSTPTHRWYHSGTTSWTINDASSRSATYWEQLKVTIIPNGLSSTYPATITAVQNGTTNNPTAYATWADWADIGSTLTISNPVTVSATERYHSLDATSWTVNSAIRPTVSYARKFLVTIATSGLSRAHPATISTIQDGAKNKQTTYATWSDWADADSTLSITRLVKGSWFGESWSTGDTTSWAVDSAISASVHYQRDYMVIYIIAGAVATAVITLVFTIRRRRQQV